MDVFKHRKDYLKNPSEEMFLEDPLTIFEKWIEKAQQKETEPTAMTLCTTSAKGQANGRIVLLKSIIDGNFCFFTDYTSRKAVDIRHNERVGLVFFWPNMERQIRIEGTAAVLDKKYSTDYFAKRPLKSQLAAWASAQSQVIPDANYLKEAYANTEKKFANQPLVPKPPEWGGYAVTPFAMEFWVGKPSRLHQRVLYSRQAESFAWKQEMLSP